MAIKMYGHKDDIFRPFLSFNIKAKFPFSSILNKLKASYLHFMLQNDQHLRSKGLCNKEYYLNFENFPSTQEFIKGFSTIRENRLFASQITGK